MKIGLLDIDKCNFPNLALMKISAYHKKLGDLVEWVSLNKYDVTYISKVFTFTPSLNIGLSDYGKIIMGGTGFDAKIKLPIEIDRMCPDYSIYPKYKAAYGFLTRGCPNKCNWCIVPHKEGNIFAYSDIEEFLEGRREAILMDNNVLAHEHGLKQIEKIIRLGIKIDFNQGLDARIIAENKDIAKLLSKVKWIRFIRMACDTQSQVPYIDKALYNLNQNGVKNYKIFVYVLVKDIPDALMRVNYLKSKGCDPFAQPYRNFDTNTQPSIEQRNFARWVNHKAIFKKIEWKDYNRTYEKQIINQ